MASTSQTDEDDGCDDPKVPSAVIEGIDDVAAGRTSDEEDLDEAIDS